MRRNRAEDLETLRHTLMDTRYADIADDVYKQLDEIDRIADKVLAREALTEDEASFLLFTVLAIINLVQGRQHAPH